MRSLQTVEEAHQGVLQELNREKAGALARIGGRLGELVTELARRHAVAAHLEGPAREAERRACRALREEARLYRWYLEVQREAVGIRGHGCLDETHPIPGTEPAFGRMHWPRTRSRTPNRVLGGALDP